jgi:hypothetical protein
MELGQRYLISRYFGNIARRSTMVKNCRMSGEKSASTWRSSCEFLTPVRRLSLLTPSKSSGCRSALFSAGNFWKVEFGPLSWRETFEKLNSDPRLGGKLLRLRQPADSGNRLASLACFVSFRQQGPSREAHRCPHNQDPKILL